LASTARSVFSFLRQTANIVGYVLNTSKAPPSWANWANIGITAGSFIGARIAGHLEIRAHKKMVANLKSAIEDHEKALAEVEPEIATAEAEQKIPLSPPYRLSPTTKSTSITR